MDTKGLTGVLGDKWGDSMNKEEAMAHMKADYEELTGRKLKNDA